MLGPGVTRVATLGEYEPSLRGTANDANLYILEGKEPGGTVFVFGGTHAEEPAGPARRVAGRRACGRSSAAG